MRGRSIFAFPCMFPAHRQAGGRRGVRFRLRAIPRSCRRPLDSCGRARGAYLTGRVCTEMITPTNCPSRHSKLEDKFRLASSPVANRPITSKVQSGLS